MKNSISFILLLFAFATTTFAQNKLGISAFNYTRGQKSMNILDVKFNTKGGAANYILVTKDIDANSAAVFKASKTGKMFPKGFVQLKNSKGFRLEIDLKNIFLSNYTIISKEGETKESFRLNFQKSEIN